MSDAAFFVNCLAGIHEVAVSRGYDILLTVCDNVDMSHLERMVENRKVDGIVLMRTFIEDKAIEMLIDQKIPFVTVGNSDYENVVQIDQDNEEACKELISILLLKQLKRIALIGGNMAQVVNQKRFQGYASAHEMMQVPLHEELIYVNHGTVEEINRAVEDILKKGADCIACMDDNICVGVLNKLKKEEVAVPGQIRVASFFNNALLENNIPPVTCLSFDVKRLGAVSGETLIDMLEKKEVRYITLLGCEILLKESTK